ncbi:peptidylprolyl isomerase [Marinobacter persicus]|jgi:peptidyl-prolyl cis-trans isomerase C|uniref:peptidylprolyl isomerase n=1 Tax=Marinobacter persicus TaxID=930118 RepID=A0A2S6G5P6_9GAMM|nr:peptidylprolyl isomerase [Marinobacter persicus]PPK50360.1 peptidyl-prolyl cis-trans isomerase C [Marinobacter persicus]PPK54442.1 peptidyl-prolyl cis-trans isomerase C [Marinobacter persicus]PPK57599.1 peptidyl-prolyl cis-trans isomerase C [Marinobacter persicus]
MQIIPVGEAGKPRNQFPPVYVGDTLIHEDDIAREMQHHPAEELAEAWHEAARSLVIRELLLHQARGLHLDKIEDEEDRIARVLELELNVPDPSEQDCERFYAANPSRFRSPTIMAVSHILLAAAPDDVQERMSQEEVARQLLSSLLDGRAQFSTLAKDYSACESRHQGGSLGQISKGQTVEEFERPVLSLNEGLNPELIETRYGWHIVRVDQRIDGEQLPYEHVKPQIRQYLSESVTRRAFRQYLQVLAAETGVEGVDLELPDSPLMQ